MILLQEANAACKSFWFITMPSFGSWCINSTILFCIRERILLSDMIKCVPADAIAHDGSYSCKTRLVSRTILGILFWLLLRFGSCLWGDCAWQIGLIQFPWRGHVWVVLLILLSVDCLEKHLPVTIRQVSFFFSLPLLPMHPVKRISFGCC